MPIDWTTDDLGTLGGTTSQAYRINASGQIVGWSLTGTGQTHGFRTAANASINATTDDIGTLGGSKSQAFAINDSGQVTGGSTNSSGVSQAFLTAPNSAINPTTDNIGALPFTPFLPEYSFGEGINAEGHVSGVFFPHTSGPYPTAFLYRGGMITEIPAVHDAADQTFTALNDHDQIAHNEIGSLLLWQNGTLTELAACRDCPPFGINNSGEVVGGGSNEFPGPGMLRAYLYSNGTLYLLQDLIPANSGWSLAPWASVINDRGQIAGVGSLNGETHAYRLDPVITPPQAISQIIDLISSFGLNQGQANALTSLLNAAVKSWNKGDTQAARRQLNSFEYLVRAQSGKALTTDEANQLLEDAEGAIQFM